MSPTARKPESAGKSEREELLERAGTARREIFSLVRGLLDEIEEAAPWSGLYSPPEDQHQLVRTAADLVSLVESAPRRLEQLLARLRPSAEVDDQALEDVEFFFSGIHGMVSQDVARLRTKLEWMGDHESSSTAQERADLSEITADLKGKYTSAMMGATASIVGEGIWEGGVEIESLLFPEKEDEFRRNDRLVDALREVLDGLDSLPREIEFEELFQGWGQGRRLDRYVLADLFSVKGQLGRLLKRSTRRALYAGDYHQIHRRETLLAERLSELESLHRSTWAEENVIGPPPECYERLVQLTLEVAAILDIRILESILGADTCKKLRHAVSAKKGDAVAAVEIPGLSSLESLLPLVAEDDLNTFFGILLGAVLKRISLSGGSRPGPASVPEPTQIEAEIAESAAEPATVEVENTPLQAIEEERVLGRSEQRLALRALHDAFRDLSAESNPSLKGFVMMERLLNKHSRIPPSMFVLAHPFFEQILDDLLPKLEAVLSFTDIPEGEVKNLESSARFLRHCDPSPEELKLRIAPEIKKLRGCLGELESMSAALEVLHSVS